MIDQWLSKLSKRERVLLFTAATTVFILLMDRAIIGPVIAQIRISEVAIEAKSQMLKRNLRIVAFQYSIMREYEKLVQYLTPPDKNLQEITADRLHAIESLAHDKAITISNISAGELKQNPITQELPILIEGEGPLKSVLDFMQMIEDQNLLFRVTKFNIAPKSKGSEVVKCSLEVLSTVLKQEKISLSNVKTK